MDGFVPGHIFSISVRDLTLNPYYADSSNKHILQIYRFK